MEKPEGTHFRPHSKTVQSLGFFLMLLPPHHVHLSLECPSHQINGPREMNLDVHPRSYEKCSQWFPPLVKKRVVAMAAPWGEPTW